MVASGIPLTQLRRGVLEFCVLAVLNTGELYGFELVKRLAETDGMVTSEGTIYPLLGRLSKDGLVEFTWRESTSGPPRKYYWLTPHGEHALNSFRDDWRVFKRSVDAVLAGSR